MSVGSYPNAEGLGILRLQRGSGLTNRMVKWPASHGAKKLIPDKGQACGSKPVATRAHAIKGGGSLTAAVRLRRHRSNNHHG